MSEKLDETVTTKEETTETDRIEIRKGEYEGLKTQLRQMREQLGEFETIKASIEKEKSEAEKTKLLEQEKFEEYKNLLEQEKLEMASQLETLKKDTIAKDLKFALANKGLKHDKALKMFVSDYFSSGAETTIDDYVNSILSDESNKIFFEGEPVRRPGGMAPSSGSTPNNSSSLAKRLIDKDNKIKEAARNELASLPDDQKQLIIQQTYDLIRSN